MSAPPLVESRLPLPLLRRGTVREVYEVDAAHLLLVASDRVSAFDIVMREPIPRKGAVLTQMSAFWFRRLTGVVPSHFVTARTEEILERLPALRPRAAELQGRTMLVRRAEPASMTDNDAHRIAGVRAGVKGVRPARRSHLRGPFRMRERRLTHRGPSCTFAAHQ